MTGYITDRIRSKTEMDGFTVVSSRLIWFGNEQFSKVRLEVAEIGGKFFGYLADDSSCTVKVDNKVGAYTAYGIQFVAAHCSTLEQAEAAAWAQRNPAWKE